MQADPPPTPSRPGNQPKAGTADIRPGWGMLALAAVLAAPLSSFLGALGAAPYRLWTAANSAKPDGDILLLTGAIAGAATGLLASWCWWTLMRRVTTARPERRQYRQFLGASLGFAMPLGAVAGAMTHLAMQIVTGQFRTDILLIGAAFGLSAGFWLGLLLPWPWATIVRKRLDLTGLLAEKAYE